VKITVLYIRDMNNQKFNKSRIQKYHR